MYQKNSNGKRGNEKLFNEKGWKIKEVIKKGKVVKRCEKRGEILN